MARYTGEMIWFKDLTGFGLLHREDGKPLFVRFSLKTDADVEKQPVDDDISFDLLQGCEAAAGGAAWRVRVQNAVDAPGAVKPQLAAPWGELLDALKEVRTKGMAPSPDEHGAENRRGFAR